MSEAPAPQSLPPSSSRHLKRGSTTSEHESGGGSSRGIKIPQLTGRYVQYIRSQIHTYASFVRIRTLVSRPRRGGRAPAASSHTRG